MCCHLSTIQIVKEYERAVIFRLGRITDRKPKGPGSSFNLLRYYSLILLQVQDLCTPSSHLSYSYLDRYPKYLTDGKLQNKSRLFLPGLFFVLPCTDNFVKVDLRTVSFDIPPQEVQLFSFIVTEIKSVNLICVSPASPLVSVINTKLLVIVLGDQNGGCIIIGAFLSLLQILTKDSVTVSVDGVVYFRIQCPISSVANVSNAHSSTRLLAQTTLRNVLGTKNLAELLSDREGISLSMQVSNLCVHKDPEGYEEIFKGIVVCKIKTNLYSGDPYIG